MRIARGSLRGTLGWIYALATILPLLVLSLFAYYHGRGQWQQQQQRLGDAAVAARHELDEQLQLHVSLVQMLARQLELGDASPVGAAASPLLASMRDHSPGLLSMIVADPRGRIVASSPAGAVGRDITDREYFTAVAEGAPWHLSDAFRGRVFGTLPIVAVSARVNDRAGGFGGLVEGTLRLARLAEVEQRHTGVPGFRLVVLDRARNVVYGGRDGRFADLAPIEEPGFSGPAGGPAFVYEDPADDGQRWLVATAESRGSGWQVLAMQPLSVFAGEARRAILSLALAAFWSLLVVLVGLRRVLERAVVPVERLAGAMRAFDVTAPAQRVPLPDGTPSEIVELTRTFESMAERTRRMITGLVPICAQCKRIRDDQDNWEPVEKYVREHSEAEFTHGLCPDCAFDLGFVPASPVPEEPVGEG